MAMQQQMVAQGQNSAGACAGNGSAAAQNQMMNPFSMGAGFPMMPGMMPGMPGMPGTDGTQQQQFMPMMPMPMPYSGQGMQP